MKPGKMVVTEAADSTKDTAEKNQHRVPKTGASVMRGTMDRTQFAFKDHNKL